MILVIDNFDSFTWNLVAQLMQLGEEVQVFRNNEISVAQAASLNPAGIVFSPGPGRPQDAGACSDLYDAFAGKTPLLGICLGHQLIGEKLGLSLVHALPPMHGKTSELIHDCNGLFRGMDQNLTVMRYHSLILEKFKSNEKTELSAQTSAGEVMGIRNKMLKLEGLQFHPESILTPMGNRMMINWRDCIRE